MKTRDWFVMLATLLIIAGAALIAIKPYSDQSALASAQESLSVIAVNGEAVLAVKPDTVVVTVGVTTDAGSAQAAMTQNSAKMNALVEELKGQGVEEEEMKTVRYHVYPRYDYSGQTQKLVGFSANNSLEITLDADHNIGLLLDKAAAAGANTIDQVTYMVRDTKQYRDRALEMAMADARQRADVLAQSAGVSIKGVRSVYESGSNPPVAPLSVRKEASMLNAMADQAATPLLTGEMEIRFHVSVEYTF